MSVRRRHLFCSVAVLALSFGVMPTARAAAPAAPVLWDGVLQTPDGQPASGEVIAFVRPPAALLKPGDQLAEVARTQTTDSGRYVLRALPSDAFRAAQDPSGWANVMVFAFSKDRVALATDAVAWRPDPGFQAQSADSTKGRWITSPADLVAEPGRLHAAEARSTSDNERPATLVLEGMGARVLHPLQANPKRPPADWTCGLVRSKDMGIHPVAVGELHLGDAWGGFFEYTNTKSTSFQTGVSYGGRGWTVGGSDSMTSTSGMTQGKTTPATAREEPALITYKAELQFNRFDWRCSKSGYSWEDISTLQPVSWPNGGMRESLGGDPPGCGSNKNWYGTTPGGTLSRRSGSSITLNRAMSVAGFSGATTAAVATGVSYQWRNEHPFHRAVCGSTGTLDGNTRAATSGVV